MQLIAVNFYFTAGLLYMFRVLSTPIIRSTINCITASGTGHIIVAATFFQRGRVWTLYRRVTLHVSGAFHTHHQEYTKLYLQPPVQDILSLQLPSSNVVEFKLGHVVKRELQRYGLYRRLWYSLVYSWWWVWKAAETCTGTLQYNKNWPRTAASCWFTVIKIYDARNQKHKIPAC